MEDFVQPFIVRFHDSNRNTVEKKIQSIIDHFQTKLDFHEALEAAKDEEEKNAVLKQFGAISQLESLF